MGGGGAEAADGSELVASDVQQVNVDGSGEQWERVTDEFDVRAAGADWIESASGWNVWVAVMEFVREDPLEHELRRRSLRRCWQSTVSSRPGKWTRRCGSSPGLPRARPWSVLRRR
jgi:hypothetical protein